VFTVGVIGKWEIAPLHDRVQPPITPQMQPSITLWECFPKRVFMPPGNNSLSKKAAAVARHSGFADVLLAQLPFA
jgi:hypothetical protein